MQVQVPQFALSGLGKVSRDKKKLYHFFVIALTCGIDIICYFFLIFSQDQPRERCGSTAWRT